MAAPTSSDGTPTIELYARSLAPRAARDRLESVAERLDDLEAAGAIETYSVRVTGKAIPATPADTVTDYGAFLCNRVAVFQEWAHQTGHSIDRQFDRRAVHSEFTGADYDAIVWPELVLAEYLDGELRFVAPCLDDGDSITVEDRLEAVARADPVEESQRLPRSRAEPPEEFSPAPH
jgi:hypothetical protein